MEILFGCKNAFDLLDADEDEATADDDHVTDVHDPSKDQLFIS